MSTPPKPFRILAMVAITGLVAATGALALMAWQRASSSPDAAGGAPLSGGQGEVTPPDVFAGFSVPAFEFVDQNGERIDQSALDGRVTVVDFFFTSCPLACPGMTARMKVVAERLEGTPVRFLSVSVDGATDTPERLRAYAETNGLDLSRWTLATGPQADVRSLLENGFGQTIRVDETRRFPVEGGGETSNVVHPVRLWLVGPDRGVEYGALYTRQDEVELLIERAGALVAAAED